MNPKRLETLQALGGLGGLASGLRTDLINGLSMDEGALEGRLTYKEAVFSGHEDANARVNPAENALLQAPLSPRHSERPAYAAHLVPEGSNGSLQDSSGDDPGDTHEPPASDSDDTFEPSVDVSDDTTEPPASDLGDTPRQPAEKAPAQVRLPKRWRRPVFDWRMGKSPSAARIASPSSTTEENLTAYIVHIDGVKLEAVADTGSAVNAISREVIRCNPRVWDVIPDVKRVTVCNGKTLRTSGHVQATLRFEGSEELHDLILYIIDGLPLNMLLSHEILVRTGTVEFKRPGAIVKAGTVHPVGSSDPAFTLVLTNLVAAKRPSMMDRLKRLSCIRLPSRQAPSTRADLAGSSNSS